MEALLEKCEALEHDKTFLFDENDSLKNTNSYLRREF
jgi:hypothetical protein